MMSERYKVVYLYHAIPGGWTECELDNFYEGFSYDRALRIAKRIESNEVDPVRDVRVEKMEEAER